MTTFASSRLKPIFVNHKVFYLYYQFRYSSPPSTATIRTKMHKMLRLIACPFIQISGLHRLDFQTQFESIHVYYRGIPHVMFLSRKNRNTICINTSVTAMEFHGQSCFLGCQSVMLGQMERLPNGIRFADLVSDAEIPTPERALLHKLEIENKRIAEDAKAHCLPKADKMHSRKGSDTSVISVTSGKSIF